MSMTSHGHVAVFLELRLKGSTHVFILSSRATLAYKCLQSVIFASLVELKCLFTVSLTIPVKMLLWSISFLVESQFCVFELWLPHCIVSWLADREHREISNDVWLFLWFHTIWCFTTSPIFVLCMCSFLTRSRGNVHSSSSSICSVNSLWVITSLLQFLNSVIILPTSLSSWC